MPASPLQHLETCSDIGSALAAELRRQIEVGVEESRDHLAKCSPIEIRIEDLWTLSETLPETAADGVDPTNA